MTCTGNCNQGRKPCDCVCDNSDWWITRISLIGSILIVVGILLGVL